MKYLNLLLFILITLMISGCSEKKKTTAAGIDIANLDTSIQPAVDFYMFANGGWLKNNPMPGDYSRYGSFDKLQEDNDNIVRELVQSLMTKNMDAGTIAGKIGTFYASGMDTLAIEKEGCKPIEPELGKIQHAKNFDEIQHLIAYYHTLEVSSLFNFFGEPDSKNSDMNIAALYQGGLGMGDRDYYLAEDARSKEIRAEYVKYITKMLQLSGYSDQSKDWAAQIMHFETRLASASRSRADLRDPEKNYNKKTLGEVEKLSPNISWSGYFKNINLSNPGEINVGQPDFFAEISKMAKDEPLEIWKAYLTWNVINEMSPYLSSAFVNARFEFYDQFMSGRKTMKPRWRRVLNTTNSVLGEALGQIYVEKYFPQAAKDRMLNLVENLRFALGERIKKLDWMGIYQRKSIRKISIDPGKNWLSG